MPTDLGSSSSAYRSTDLEGADPGADQKRRARWRLLGATVFSLGVATAAYQLMLQEPRPLAHDFVVLMPVGEADGSRRAVRGPIPLTTTPDDDQPSAATGASGLAAERVEAPVVVAVTPSSKASAAGADPNPPSLSTGSASGAGGSRAWFVQLGAYDSQEAAAAMATKVRGLGYSATVQGVPSTQGGGRLYRVRVGPFNEAQANAYLQRARAQGYASFLVRP
ncbi:MAG: hypothetical protein RLZZ344_1730 [Pseudomonadota bacterium]|jgi:cell division septation protein DedD